MSKEGLWVIGKICPCKTADSSGSVRGRARIFLKFSNKVSFDISAAVVEGVIWTSFNISG